MDYKLVYELEELEAILRSFMRKKERVLLCFPKEGSLVGPYLEDMILRCGGVAIFWDQDLLWKSLLKKSFQERCGVVIGGADIILSLSKLAKRVGTPLYLRNALLVGQTPDKWMVEMVEQALDCKVRGCYCHLKDREMDSDMDKLRQELRRWSTVLDYKLERTGAGLSLEMTVFPREKLPKLPSFARLVVREWDGERDGPLEMPLPWKKMIFSKQNH